MRKGTRVLVDGLPMWVVRDSGVEVTLTSKEPCQHKRVNGKMEYNCFPYGDDIMVSTCADCGERVSKWRS